MYDPRNEVVAAVAVTLACGVFVFFDSLKCEGSDEIRMSSDVEENEQDRDESDRTAQLSPELLTSRVSKSTFSVKINGPQTIVSSITLPFEDWQRRSSGDWLVVFFDPRRVGEWHFFEQVCRAAHIARQDGLGVRVGVLCIDRDTFVYPSVFEKSGIEEGFLTPLCIAVRDRRIVDFYSWHLCPLLRCESFRDEVEDVYSWDFPRRLWRRLDEVFPRIW